jgi:hypothetical protein
MSSEIPCQARNDGVCQVRNDELRPAWNEFRHPELDSGSHESIKSMTCHKSLTVIHFIFCSFYSAS